MNKGECVKIACLNIKKHRIKNNISLQEMSKMTGLSVSNLKRIETGDANFTMKSLFKIMLALDLTYEILLK